jgi:predicted nucleotidyltransferase
MEIAPGIEVDGAHLAAICDKYGIGELADELEELFSRPVDLVSLRALHPLLRPSVLAEARPLYAA